MFLLSRLAATVKSKSISRRLLFLYVYKMNKITDVKFGPLENSIYLKPLQMSYKQDGKEKSWDLMSQHDSVAIILYNVTRNVMLFVKQFRPGVYFANLPSELRDKPIDMAKYPAELGITLELCAGIVDKEDISLAQIAKEEVLEECGYDVPIENLERIKSFNVNVGASGNVMTMYYCQVTDDMRVSTGGGVESEWIDVVEMSLDECNKYVEQSHVLSPASVLLGYYWFLKNKLKQ